MCLFLMYTCKLHLRWCTWILGLNEQNICKTSVQPKKSALFLPFAWCKIHICCFINPQPILFFGWRLQFGKIIPLLKYMKNYEFMIKSVSHAVSPSTYISPRVFGSRFVIGHLDFVMFYSLYNTIYACLYLVRLGLWFNTNTNTNI